MKYTIFCTLLLLLSACQSTDEQSQALHEAEFVLAVPDSIVPANPPTPSINIDSILSLPDSAWVDLALLLPKARFDIRYAGTNNFMELQVYECPACFTRLEVAKALLGIQKELDSLGLAFKFFDCYRPSSAQWALWNKMPDPRYVHPPKQGSMHSRGNALDLTLVVDSSDQELNMGTAFDYFGKEAYWNYTEHPKEVNENRQLLRRLMYARGFITVPTEWWHFAYNNKKYPLSDMQWTCEGHKNH